MIKNFWNNVILLCGNPNHTEEISMSIVNGTHSLFYACPKYSEENRNNNERACPNRINLIDYEAMLNHISEMVEQAILDNTTINLTSHKWTKKGITFEVISFSEDKIVVTVLDSRKFR